jgi:hypothetical protein
VDILLAEVGLDHLRVVGDGGGRPCHVFEQGETASFFCEFELLADIEVPTGGVEMVNEKGTIVHGKTTLEYGSDVPRAVARGSRLRLRQDITLEIAVGEYTFNVGVGALRRADYDRVIVLYGARTPEDLLYRRELERWRGRFDTTLLVIVDRGGPRWHGYVGVVTALLQRVKFDPAETVAMLCGPEVMMRYAVRDLGQSGIPADRVWVSMERNMRCGVGFFSEELVLAPEALDPLPDPDPDAEAERDADTEPDREPDREPEPERDGERERAADAERRRGLGADGDGDCDRDTPDPELDLAFVRPLLGLR